MMDDTKASKLPSTSLLILLHASVVVGLVMMDEADDDTFLTPPLCLQL